MSLINEADNVNKDSISNIEPVIKFIDIDGLKICYERSGRGTPFILLHGWGCNLETVRSIARTASKNCTVYNIDLPGFGKSDEPTTVWGIEEYTRLIESFIKQLKINKPIIAGHSFGGRVGILYSSRNIVEKLILIDAAGIKPKRKLKYYLKVYSFKFSKVIIKSIFPKKKADEMLNRMRSKRGSADYNSASPMMKSILSKTVNQDLKYVMPKIIAPTLLIWGEKDTATPLKDAHIMEKLIPNSGLVVFDGAGHYSFLDNPFGFKAVLTSFLNS